MSVHYTTLQWGLNMYSSNNNNDDNTMRIVWDRCGGKTVHVSKATRQQKQTVK